MKRTCTNCIYAIKLSKTGLSVLVCANRQGSPGRLTLTGPTCLCTNFKTKHIVNRPDVTQPAGSSVRLIPLTQGKVAIVDAEDYDWLIQYKWHTNKKTSGFYAATHKGAKLIYMHRLIMQNCPRPNRSSHSATKNSTLRTQHYPCRIGKGIVVDHIDGNSLNNTKANLRICTNAQNHYNQRPRGGSSKYKGVSWYKTTKKWSAAIEKNNKQFHLGCFNNEKDAAMAYDAKAKELFGDFAYLNFRNPRNP